MNFRFFVPERKVDALGSRVSEELVGKQFHLRNSDLLSSVMRTVVSHRSEDYTLEYQPELRASYVDDIKRSVLEATEGQVVFFECIVHLFHGSVLKKGTLKLGIIKRSRINFEIESAILKVS